MNDDQLRDRLASLRTDHGVPTDPVTSDRARTLLEQIMSTLDDTTGRTDTGRTHVPAASPPLAAVSPPVRPRRRWLGFGALAALGAAAVAAFAVAALGPTDTAITATELNLAPSDPLTQMCAMFDPAVLAAVPVAFGGTVTDILPGATAEAETTVRIEVDRWYRGGDSDVVDVVAPAGFTAALDGVDFVVGERYLVSAIDGSVTSCGLSGPATPEFEQIWADVFG